MVNGIEIAARTLRRIFSTSGKSRSRPEPPLHFTTLFTGQPKLMSTMSKPMSWQMARGVRHHRRIGAEQLRRDRMLLGVESQVAEASASAWSRAPRRHHAVRAGEFGHDQTAAALIANQAAENRIGDARHGREHGRRSDLIGADLELRGTTCTILRHDQAPASFSQSAASPNLKPARPGRYCAAAR